MADDMEKRLSRSEWRLDALEERQERQEAKTADLGARIDAHHREVMSAIAGLKEDSTRREGVEQARKEAEETNLRRMRMISIAIGIITALAALGFWTWPGAGV